MLFFFFFFFSSRRRHTRWTGDWSSDVCSSDLGRQGLTDRELEIVVLTGSGHIVPEIAALLGISPQRVENLKRRVYAKLDVSSGAHAVARAASLGMLDREAPPVPRRPAPEGEAGVLSVVCGQPGRALDRVVVALLSSHQPFVLMRGPGPAGDAHWARWHRGPLVAVLVDPEQRDWDLVAGLAIPAILVHSEPFDSPELASALATGASALVAEDRGERADPAVPQAGRAEPVRSAGGGRRVRPAALAHARRGCPGRRGRP